MQSIKIKLILASWLALLAIPAAPALARDGSSETGTDSSTATATTENGSETTSGNTTRTRVAEAENGSTKSESGKLKACQNREKSINTRLQNIANRGQRQLNLFNTIAQRTEKFYTDKKLTVANYGDLTSAVDTQKIAAQNAVNKIKTDSVTFKCDGSDPKGQVEVFKTDLKSEISALKSYKTAVKNLIVGVKKALNTTSNDTTEAQNANH